MMNRKLKRKQLIKMWLIRKAVKQKDIATELGVSEAMITRWIVGSSRSDRVAKWFSNNGLPERWFTGKR